MKTKYWKRICVFLILQFPIYFVIAKENTAPMVNAEIKLSAKQYEIGESILFDLLIKSNSDDSVLLREDFFQNIKNNFIVINPDGIRLRSKSELIYRVAHPYRWLKTSVMKPYVIRLSLNKQIFVSSYHSQFAHTVEKPGFYTIQYKTNATTKLEGAEGILWQGELSTNRITFEVLQVEDNTFNEIKQVVLGNASSKADLMESILKVKYASPDTALQVLESVLKNNDDSDVQIAAIRVLANIENERSFLLIKQMLDSKNAFVRAEAIAALRKFKKYGAIDLLVTEVVTKKERSYRAAIVILGEIANKGDKLVLKSLENVIKTDQEEWVRIRAKESIDKILRRN